MNEIIFIVEDAPEGGFIARATSQCIFTQAADWFELEENIIEAVECHFEEGAAQALVRPDVIRIQFENAVMTLKIGQAQACATEQATMDTEKNRTSDFEFPDEPRILSIPVTSIAILLKMLGSMFIGFLAGLCFFFIAFLNTQTHDEEGKDNFLLSLYIAFIGSGLATGLLLSKFCPRRAKLHPLQRFTCSPIIYYIIIIFMLYFKSDPKLLEEGLSNLLAHIVAAMFISWMGALLGWGVYSLVSKKISKPSLVKG